MRGCRSVAKWQSHYPLPPGRRCHARGYIVGRILNTAIKIITKAIIYMDFFSAMISIISLRRAAEKTTALYYWGRTDPSGTEKSAAYILPFSRNNLQLLLKLSCQRESSLILDASAGWGVLFSFLPDDRQAQECPGDQ